MHWYSACDRKPYFLYRHAILVHQLLLQTLMYPARISQDTAAYLHIVSSYPAEVKSRPSDASFKVSYAVHVLHIRALTHRDVCRAVRRSPCPIPRCRLWHLRRVRRVLRRGDVVHRPHARTFQERGAGLRNVHDGEAQHKRRAHCQRRRVLVDCCSDTVD